LNPFFVSNETPDCAFHVSHTWQKFHSGYFKVGQSFSSCPVSDPAGTQAVAKNDLPPPAVGGRGLQKSGQKKDFLESCVKVGDILNY
jgi:hypothetical protein